MGWLKKMIVKVFGKKIIEDGIEKSGISKTKLTAIVFILITGIEQASAAWGHPIVIPAQIKELLAGVGLWTLRDALAK